MKKLVLGLFALSSVAAMADMGVNVYTKVGLEKANYRKITIEDMERSHKNKVSSTIAVEVTKNVTKDLELGAGLGFTQGKGLQKFTAEGDDGKTDKIEVKGYKSIPLYAVAKYNFDLGSDVKPYVKADLGYSFNKKAKLYADLYVKDEDEGVEGRGTVTEKVKIKNGLYYSLGAGVEYQNFVTELAYVHTSAKAKLEDGDREKVNRRAVRLSVGYKFGF